MRRKLLFMQRIFIFIVLLTSFKAQAQKDTLIFTYNLQSEVSPGMARTFSKAMNIAETKEAAAFLIHMNTYGGMLDAADSIRTIIINSKIPVYVFIDRNAASAGALISIACTKIFMRNGSSFGAATVVNQQGEAAPDKYQSYMRAMMRATAEKRNRNPRIAEAMVDPRIVIPGVNDSGRVLTFTAQEAIANNYCDGLVESQEALLAMEGFVNYKTEIFEPSLLDKCIGFLINPAVSGFLILIMLAGLYFEFQAPGTIFPIAASAVAAILYFAPLYLEGLAANWEILIFLIGVILLAAEFFVIPGFGIAGIAGIVLTTVGFSLSMLNNDGFDFTFTTQEQITRSLAISAGSLFFSVLLIFYFIGKLSTSKRFKSLTLQTDQHHVSSTTAAGIPVAPLKDRTGIAFTPLRPAGKVIIDNHSYDAVSESDWIEKGSKIVVVAHGLTLVVRAV
jgi:membrane-bound serine protease (ClpP class)